VIQPASPKRRERERKKKERKKKTRTKEKQQEKKKKKKKSKPGLLSSYSPPDAPNGKNTGTAPPPPLRDQQLPQTSYVRGIRASCVSHMYFLSLSLFFQSGTGGW